MRGCCRLGALGLLLQRLLPQTPLPRAQLTVVFAQLHTRGKWEGVHAFAVRIRDDHMAVVPGVRVRDMGPKQGLNGVDNGQVGAQRARVDCCCCCCC